MKKTLTFIAVAILLLQAYGFSYAQDKIIHNEPQNVIPAYNGFSFKPVSEAISEGETILAEYYTLIDGLNDTEFAELKDILADIHSEECTLNDKVKEILDTPIPVSGEALAAFKAKVAEFKKDLANFKSGLGISYNTETKKWSSATLKRQMEIINSGMRFMEFLYEQCSKVDVAHGEANFDVTHPYSRANLLVEEGFIPRDEEEYLKKAIQQAILTLSRLLITTNPYNKELKKKIELYSRGLPPLNSTSDNDSGSPIPRPTPPGSRNIN